MPYLTKASITLLARHLDGTSPLEPDVALGLAALLDDVAAGQRVDLTDGTETRGRKPVELTETMKGLLREVRLCRSAQRMYVDGGFKKSHPDHKDAIRKLAYAIEDARDGGCPWAEIGKAMSMTNGGSAQQWYQRNQPPTIL